MKYRISRMSDQEAYLHYRRDEGHDPRTAILLVRAYRRAQAWGEACEDADFPYGGGATYTYDPEKLPADSRTRRDLAALDPDLSRWRVVLSVFPDDGWLESPRHEVEACGLEIEYFAEHLDDWSYDPDASRCEDPRSYSSHWAYVRCEALDKSGREAQRYAYLTLDPKEAHKHYVPKGTARALVASVCRAGVTSHLEVFASYLDRKYKECSSSALCVRVEVRWRGEVVGDAQCAGYYPNESDLAYAAEAAQAALDMDLIAEAVGEAERAVRTLVSDAIKKAQRAVYAAEHQLEALRRDALGKKGAFPAAAYEHYSTNP